MEKRKHEIKKGGPKNYDKSSHSDKNPNIRGNERKMFGDDEIMVHFGSK